MALLPTPAGYLATTCFGIFSSAYQHTFDLLEMAPDINVT